MMNYEIARIVCLKAPGKESDYSLWPLLNSVFIFQIIDKTLNGKKSCAAALGKLKSGFECIGIFGWLAPPASVREACLWLRLRRPRRRAGKLRKIKLLSNFSLAIS